MLPRWDTESIPHWARVAIAILRTERGHHLGMIHVSQTEGAQMLHLAWHLQLINDRVPTGAYFVIPDIHPRVHTQLAAKCRMVVRFNIRSGIPYGFSNPLNAFTPGRYTFDYGLSGHGLTCASFVLSLFHLADTALIDYSTWPASRPEDLAWQNAIVENLARRLSWAPHAALLRDSVGVARYRPEEVLAAAMAPEYPASFEFASARGAQIVAFLASR